MPPLAGLAIALLPDLAKRVADDVLPDVERRISDAVRDFLGVDDVAEARRRIEDPQIAAELRVRLAAIEAEARRAEQAAETTRIRAEVAATAARLHDRQDARSMLTALTGQGSAIAAGPVVVSVVVTGGFFATLLYLIAGGLEVVEADRELLQIVNIAVGALTAGFATVVSFWLGSSEGSRRKDVTAAVTQNAVAELQRETTQTTRQLASEQSRQTNALIEKVAQPMGLAAALPATPSTCKNARQFHACMEIVLRHEGGYVDHPDDPGGATNMGITHRTLAAWRGVERCTRDEVRALTVEEAKEIYRANYWNALNCDQLPAGVDLVTFDFGVNAGVGRSARMLQRILSVAADGQIGPITVGAAQRSDAAWIVERFSEDRLGYYRALRHWATFGRGWSRRTSETREAALAMT